MAFVRGVMRRRPRETSRNPNPSANTHGAMKSAPVKLPAVPPCVRDAVSGETADGGAGSEPMVLCRCYTRARRHPVRAIDYPLSELRHARLLASAQ